MAKVFISYSHDSAEHSERVLRFADALRCHGVDAEIDRYYQRPPQGWPAWCEEQLRPEISSHVLMICTQTYHDRVLSYGSPPVRFVRELLFDDQPFLTLKSQTMQLASEMVENSVSEGLDLLA